VSIPYSRALDDVLSPHCAGPIRLEWGSGDFSPSSYRTLPLPIKSHRRARRGDLGILVAFWRPFVVG
jgi:hypothetical protein